MAVTHQGDGWARGTHVHRWTGLRYNYSVTYSRRGAVMWDARITFEGRACGHLHGQLFGLDAETDIGRFIAEAHVEVAIDRGTVRER